MRAIYKQILENKCFFSVLVISFSILLVWGAPALAEAICAPVCMDPPDCTILQCPSPELDSSSFEGAIAFIMGALLMIRGRKKGKA